MCLFHVISSMIVASDCKVVAEQYISTIDKRDTWTHMVSHAFAMQMK